jgi:hypothetical protein
VDKVDLVGRLPVRYPAVVADTQLDTRDTRVLPVLGTRYPVLWYCLLGLSALGLRLLVSSG